MSANDNFPMSPDESVLIRHELNKVAGVRGVEIAGPVYEVHIQMALGTERDDRQLVYEAEQRLLDQFPHLALSFNVHREANR